jgi:hypothetical protein
MIPIENFITCSNKLEKLKKERFYIKTLNGTLNYDIPGIKLELGKIGYDKQYRENNLEQIKEKSNKKFKCQCCCGHYNFANKHRHLRTLMHQNYIKIREIISNHKSNIQKIDEIIEITKKFINLQKLKIQKIK